jgi:DNA-binding transcriptional MocR family regulator
MLTDRRIGAARLVALLGAWRRDGVAYGALADALRASILSGAVPLRTTLPGERELADALDVSRTTTASAYDVLRTEGYLVSRRGSGTVTTLPTGRTRHPETPAAPVDHAVLDLSVAAPPAPTRLHAAYLDALDALPRHLATTGYSPLGVAELREAVAERYTRRGTPTTPDQVLVTSGAQHAIHLLLAAHCGPGDRVAVEHPTYPGAVRAVRAAGARPVPVPVHADGLDVDLLESTVRQVAPRVAYLIPDNQNPTGTSLSAPARDRVRALARRTRTLVVGDEALTDLVLDGPSPEPLAGDGRSGDLVVSVGSASKSFWGGLRVGWVRADADLVARLAAERGHVDLGTPVLEQLVTARLLADGDDALDERRAYLRERRDVLGGLLAERLPDWRVTLPAGGLSFWVDLGVPVSSALVALCARLGLRLAAGPAFGVDGSFERYLRLPFTADGDALERAVAILADAWAAVGVPTQRPPEGSQAFAALV